MYTPHSHDTFIVVADADIVLALLSFILAALPIEIVNDIVEIGQNSDVHI